MPATGLFILAPQVSVAAAAPSGDPQNLSISHRIFNKLVARHNPDPLADWSVNYLLFRETPHGADRPPDGLLQVVTLSYPTVRTFAGISRPPRKSGEVDSQLSSIPAPDAPKPEATLLQLPASSQNDFSALVAARFAALWARKQWLQVMGGKAYQVGDFAVRFGEVRDAGRQAQGAQNVRGTVVVVEYSGKAGVEGVSQSDENAEEAVRQFWAELEVAGAREFVAAHGSSTGEADVRLWMEALKPRT